MSKSQVPAMQFFSHEFVLSAGSVLFRLSPTSPYEICLIHHARNDEWLLPKGRKDRGESLHCTALRETFEETGWRAEPFGATMFTRATVPGVAAEQPDTPRLASDLSSEPFAITIRGDPEKRDVKIIHWFLFCVTGAQTHQTPGTQMEGEGFDEAVFWEAEKAIGKLTFEGDRALAKKAFEIVTGTLHGL